MLKKTRLAVASSIALALFAGQANARWLSVDPVQADPSTGQNFNRYWYGNNNPYKFIDPDGREVVIVGDDAYKKQAQENVDTLRSEPAGRNLHDRLDASSNVHTIRAPGPGERNSTQALEKAPSTNNGGGTGSTIVFDPNDTTGAPDATGSTDRPSYVALAHEFGHAGAIDEGAQSYDFGSGQAGTTPPSETQAMGAENAVRLEHDLPERPAYYHRDAGTPR